MSDRPPSRIAAGFNWLATAAGEAMGSAPAFSIAALAVLLWAASGPWFAYSDTWQLIINTGTTVLTFLAVFLIQHSQNRDNRAMQLKLDELLQSTKHARKRLIDLEHCTDEEMRELQDEFAKIQKTRHERKGLETG